MAAAASTPSVAVSGMIAASPPSRRMSRVPVSWSTMPACMNSAALNAAWFMMWKIAAATAAPVPKPSSITMSPNWLIVE